MSCFLEIFHRYLDVMLFSRNMKNHIVFTLILGGLKVDISLVLVMFSEFHVFVRCVFYRFLWTFQRKKQLLGWSKGAQNSGNTNEILINHVFSVSSIVRKLNENEENHEIQKSIWRYYSNENGDFHEMNEAWTWKSRWSPKGEKVIISWDL